MSHNQPPNAIDALLATILSGARVEGAALAAHDPEIICLQALYHDILPLVAERLADRTDVSAALQDRLRDLAHREAATDLVREVELRRVLASLHAAGVKPLLVKGSHLAYSHYARPDLRPRVDSDVLIPSDARDIVNDVLTRELGYVASSKVSGELMATQKTYVKETDGVDVHALDVHWRLASPQVFAHMPTYDELAASAVPLPRLHQNALGPSDVHALLIACVHPVAHHAHEEQFKWLYDIHVISTRLADDRWEPFVALAADRKVARVCLYSLGRAATLFQTAIPAWVQSDPRLARGSEEELSAAYLTARPQARVVVDDLRALPSWGDRGRLMREHLFPSADYMRRLYAPSSSAPLPVLYVVRFFRGAWKWLGLSCLLLLNMAAPVNAQRVETHDNTRPVSVTDFGAVGDGVTDSTAAIQAAIDSVSRNPTRGRVFFPSGTSCYQITAPLRLRTPGLRLEGENFALPDAGTCLTASGFAGPMIHATVQATQDLSLTDSLVQGPGRALAVTTKTQDTATYLDLQDAAAARLDGLSAFTAELFFRLDANNPNYPALWASSGSLGGTDPLHDAFLFQFDDSLRLTARLHLGASVYSISSEPLRLKQVYHAAMTYDGTTMRFFIGTPGTTSTLVGSRAASGTVTQGPYELMPVGGRRGSWPHGARVTDVVEGVLDSPRLSKTARYLAPYRVPKTKLTFDADTLLLENFDRETIDFSIVQTSRGTTYLPKYSALPGLLGPLEIDHLQLNIGAGIGIWLHGVFMSNFHHLGLLGGVFGISGREANFLNSFSNLHVNSGTRPYAKAGIALTTNVSITSIRDSSFSAWPTAIAMTDSGGGEFNNLFVHGGQQIIPFILQGSSVHLNSVFCSNEDADDRFQADVRLTGNQNIAITGGTFERYINAGPAIQVDGGAAITLTAPWFQMHAAAKEVIAVLSAPSRKVLILNGNVTPDIPWSTSTAHIAALP